MKINGKWLRTAVVLLIGCLPVVAYGEKDAMASDNIFTLGEVVVTEERMAVNATSIVTEVSMAEITAKGAKTAAEALGFLPGVFVQVVGKGEAHVSIRGFDQNQVKVLIDGVPARESYFGTVDLSMLPADAISKITISKGAGSVLYGSNTMGGVINIITKNGGKTPQTALTVSFGDYGAANCTLSHGGNPDLKPERTLAYEIGADTQLTDKVSGSVAFFYNDIDDLIEMIKSGSDMTYISVNEAVIYGAEATLKLKITDAFHTSLNYTYLITQDKSENNGDLQGRPRHRANIGLTYRFGFGLTADLQAGYYRQQYWLNGSNEWVELPEVFLLNTKLTQKLKRVGNFDSEVFVQGANLLDLDYYETSG